MRVMLQLSLAVAVSGCVRFSGVYSILTVSLLLLPFSGDLRRVALRAVHICAPLWHALWRRAHTLAQCMLHAKFYAAKPQRQFRIVCIVCIVCILEFYCGVVGLIAAACSCVATKLRQTCE